jgi:hypothetical protein
MSQLDDSLPDRPFRVVDFRPQFFRAKFKQSGSIELSPSNVSGHRAT